LASNFNSETRAAPDFSGYPTDQRSGGRKCFSGNRFFDHGTYGRFAIALRAVLPSAAQSSGFRPENSDSKSGASSSRQEELSRPAISCAGKLPKQRNAAAGNLRDIADPNAAKNVHAGGNRSIK